MPVISLFLAASDNGAIGKDGRLPWRLSRDLHTFSQRTKGHAVIMGRRTYESIPDRFRPLPERQNIVVTRSPVNDEEVETTISFDEALSKAENTEEVFVIGGARIFEEALPRADRVYLTRVHARIDGDTYLPAIDWNNWKCTYKEEWPEDEKNEYPATFFICERV